MKIGRWVAIPLVLTTGYLATVACSAPQKGALILAVSTDMQTPKDVSVISIFITTDSVVKFDYLGRVLPDGTVSLPATLSIVEPDTQSAEVRIRVIAFQEQKARVLRDVLTTVPHERTALLRVPLNFLDDGSGQGTVDPTFVPSAASGVPDGQTTFDPDTVNSRCDFSQNQTSVDGVCVDAHVDSTTLPDYADSEVYGSGGSASSTSCFEVTSCFATAQAVTNLDSGSCSFPLPPGANPAELNLAIVTGGTGDCLQSGRCFVPLENDPNEGWSVSGSTVQLVSPICTLLGAGAQLYLSEGACPAKTESTPVCEPTGGGGRDGGANTCSGPVTITCPTAGTCSGPPANCGPNSCNNPPEIQLDINGSSATITVGGKDGGLVTAQGQVKDPASCTVYFPGLPVGCNGGPIDVTLDLQSGQLSGTGAIGGGSSGIGDGSSSCSGTATCTFSGCTVSYSGGATDSGASDGTAFCAQNGGSCSSPSQCCSGQCTIPSGQTLGTCGGSVVNEGGSSCPSGVNGLPLGAACSGGACGGGCSSGNCSKAGVCIPASGCRPAGDSCTKDSDCCGSQGMAGASTSLVTCDLTAGPSCGVCKLNLGCKPAGEHCRLATNSCNTQSDDCCSGNAAIYPTCALDNAGVPRCLVTVDAGCGSAGQACATNLDCCGSVPCVPNPGGSPPLVCASTSCIAVGSACTDDQDCCSPAVCTNSLCK